jgi:hypothetical protein
MASTAYVGKFDECGSRNTFYRLNNRRYGFKSFESKTYAEFAYRVQKHLATIDLAPRVYGEVGRIRLPVDQYETELSDWGYITEIARPMPECYDDECDGACCDSGCDNRSIIDDVLGCLEEAGLNYIDAHAGNFGFIRRKGVWVPVVIDVGYESFDYFDGEVYGADPFYGTDEDVKCGCRFCREARENNNG